MVLGSRRGSTVGGIGSNYVTNSMLLERGIELLTMLKEDMNSMGTEDLHQLLRTRELNHRIDENWHCFTLSRYDRHTVKREMEKAPVYHIID